MKKSIIAAAFIVSTGIFTSCSKQRTVAPTASVIEKNTSPFRKDIGTAD